MSYATYSAATGLPRIQPNQTETFTIHAHRDRIIDNKTITSNLRLVNRAAIKTTRMYATVELPGTTETLMPFSGTLELYVSGASAGNTITINNPFITGNVNVNIITSPDSTATVTIPASGQALLTLTAGVDGVYIISVLVNKETLPF